MYKALGGITIFKRMKNMWSRSDTCNLSARAGIDDIIGF